LEFETRDQRESDLPIGLAKPALRALVAAGYLRLEQFAELSEFEVQKLHGIGPNALELLRSAFAAKGQAFAQKEQT
jgi:hypothetical protein